MSEDKLILIVWDQGDPSVGIYPQAWTVVAPFSRKDAMNDGELREGFRKEIEAVYKEYAEGRVMADYDFETDKE